jgi:hypothetical protein
VHRGVFFIQTAALLSGDASMRAIDSKVINIDELKLEHLEKGDKFESDARAHRPLLGAKDLGYSYDVVPPGSARALSTVIAARRRCSSSSRARGRCAMATKRERFAPAT